MSITNLQSGTNVEEVAEGIYRINTPVSIGETGEFSFNQYLVVDDQPLIFHTGPRRMFPLVTEAVATVIPIDTIKYISFSHFEADECGSLNEWLAVAPQAVPLCGGIAAMTSIGDIADREPKVLADGEAVSLGSHTLTWLDTPHLPHAWECGFLFDDKTKTLLCGDLFTQPGPGKEALTRSDILEPSEMMRAGLDYYSHCANGRAIFDRLAGLAPATLACMHGSAWTGDGAALLRELSKRLYPTD